MRNIKLVFGLLILTAFLFAACSSPDAVNEVMSENSAEMENSVNTMDSGDQMAEDEMADEMSNDMSDDSHDAVANSVDDNMQDETDQMTEETTDSSESEGSFVRTPPWFDYQFVDASTGETFTINDFRGKVILVETMAMWCSNCLRQQKEVRELHNLLGERDDFVGIGIDVDLNEDLVRLADYTQNNGFDWYYSIANQDVLSGISETLGGQFLNPPSTPIVIIDKDGNLHPLPFGIKSADSLLAAVELYLN
jgi:thiol-disulfide isomerase/thioredoxin